MQNVLGFGVVKQTINTPIVFAMITNKTNEKITMLRDHIKE
jgi:hypothetical protein